MATGSAQVWLSLGTALVAGGGVWATHFVAMLAYSTDVPVGYDLVTTALSLAVAVVGMGCGFAIARLHNERYLVPGGLVIGLSIVAMHFTGIAAIQSSFGIAWRWPYVVASIVLACAGATTALVALRRLSGVASWILPPVLLVVGIVGLHFTAMAAIELIPDLSRPAVEMVANRMGLATMTGAVALLIIAAAGALILMESHGRKAGLMNLEAAFQGMSAGMAMFDPAGRLVLWNEAYARLLSNFGIVPAVGLGRYDLVRQAGSAGRTHPDPSDLHVWAKDAEAERYAGEAQEWVTPAHGRIKAELCALPSGGTVTILTDVSEAHAYAEAMADARDRAEAASRAKSEFIANMSHEIRTPLNGILGMAQVMQREEMSPSQQERLQVVKESGAALLSILNGVLDLAKVQAGKLLLELDAVDAAGLARTVGAAFQGEAAVKGLSLEVEVAPDAEGMWRADPVRVRQVLSNLTGNALKFTHEGGVRLIVGRCAEGLTFEVRDTGIGVSDDQAQMLFGRFEQADTSTTRRYGGTGLGLAICKELADLMGGTLAVDSTEGEGSRFSFTVPAEYLGPAVVTEMEGRSELQEDRRLRILAAEDNPTNQLVLRSLLAAVDCDLEIVGDGRQAVAAAKTGHFDLILMDIQMPEINGVEATRAIRAHEATIGRRTPIIALSANVMNHQVKEYAEAGIDHSVAKPIELAKLFAAIELVLADPSQARRSTAA
ncbi:ATP-binding protein [Phenylobacterium sp.]|uniref:ATP-binding protein n=1 Tax=Phenylobacterium sp. TaxID=1871053 RepID=UPI002736A379|nr:ATP-binding protein [Phenylobacterium sp.]MDP3660959.1 ATP-binding protein [Phenylobacterium sp.]